MEGWEWYRSGARGRRVTYEAKMYEPLEKPDPHVLPRHVGARAAVLGNATLLALVLSLRAQTTPRDRYGYRSASVTRLTSFQKCRI